MHALLWNIILKIIIWSNELSSLQNPWRNTMSGEMNEANGEQHSIWMDGINQQEHRMSSLITFPYNCIN